MRSPHGALTILLLVLAIAHVAFARSQPAPTAFGDETHYAKVAQRDLSEGALSLLPGALRPAMRPEFAARVFANLAAEPGPSEGKADFARSLIGRVLWLHLALHLATLALIFRQGRLLGVGGWGSFAAAAAFGLFPWSAFHVQTLWPETLHAFCAALALTALLEVRARGALPLLVPAGLALGFALLTKSTLSLWVPVAALFALAWAGRPANASERRPGRALLGAGLFTGAVALVLLPQMNANREAGFGFGLGSNRWWNLELSLVTPARVVETPENERYGVGKWRVQRGITDDYMATSKDPLEREAAARRRSLAHIEEQGWFAVATEQLVEFVDVLSARPGLAFYRGPCLEQALGYRKRWGDAPPGWIAALAWPARPMWWLLLAIGGAGLVRAALRDRRFWLPLAGALCVLGVVLVVPLKFRFLQPLVPILCLGLGAWWPRGVDSAQGSQLTE